MNLGGGIGVAVRRTWIESCLPGAFHLDDFAGPEGLPAESVRGLAHEARRAGRSMWRERGLLLRSDRRSREHWLGRRVRIEGAEPLIEACREGAPVLATLPFTGSLFAALAFLAVRLKRSLVVPRYPVLDPLLSPWTAGATGSAASSRGGVEMSAIPPTVARGLEILEDPAALLITFPDLWHRSWPAAGACFLGQPIRASIYEGLLQRRLPSLRIFPVVALRGEAGVGHRIRVGSSLSQEDPEAKDPRECDRAGIAATAARLFRVVEETAKSRPRDLLSWRNLHGCLRSSQLARLWIEGGMIRSCLALLEAHEPAMSGSAARVRSLADAAARALRAASEGDLAAAETFRERARHWERSLQGRTA